MPQSDADNTPLSAKLTPSQLALIEEQRAANEALIEQMAAQGIEQSVTRAALGQDREIGRDANVWNAFQTEKAQQQPLTGLDRASRGQAVKKLAKEWHLLKMTPAYGKRKVELRRKLLAKRTPGQVAPASIQRAVSRRLHQVKQAIKRLAFNDNVKILSVVLEPGRSKVTVHGQSNCVRVLQRALGGPTKTGVFIRNLQAALVLDEAEGDGKDSGSTAMPTTVLNLRKDLPAKFHDFIQRELPSARYERFIKKKRCGEVAWSKFLKHLREQGKAQFNSWPPACVGTLRYCNEEGVEVSGTSVDDVKRAHGTIKMGVWSLEACVGLWEALDAGSLHLEELDGAPMDRPPAESGTDSAHLGAVGGCEAESTAESGTDSAHSAHPRTREQLAVASELSIIIEQDEGDTASPLTHEDAAANHELYNASSWLRPLQERANAHNISARIMSRWTRNLNKELCGAEHKELSQLILDSQQVLITCRLLLDEPVTPAELQGLPTAVVNLARRRGA